MRVEQFLLEHDIERNPFATGEEAQGDHVLLDVLAAHDGEYGHPRWPKFCGDPPGNQTSFVFGMKGSGKTAMRIALEERIKRYNAALPERQILFLLYAHFNPYLSTWKNSVEHSRKPSKWRLFGRRKTEPVSLRSDWYLADHLDAILAEAAQKLCDVVQEAADARRWDVQMKRDLLLLVAIYLPLRSDRYRKEILRVRRRLFSVWARALMRVSQLWRWWRRGATAKHLARVIRVVQRDVNDTKWALRNVPGRALQAWTLLRRDTQPQDEQPRREVLSRFRSIAQLAGYERIVVVVDRVDEPTMIHGDYTLMSDFLLPLLDNQILQTEGISFKLLLPSQLHSIISKAGPEKANIIRADKANVIYPLEWPGAALYQMLTERAAVCARDSQFKSLHDLFEPAISAESIITELDRMRTPRYAGKLMEACIANACGRIVSPPSEGEKPRILKEDFYRACERVSALIREDAQTLLEF